jgi:pyruvate kinase
MSTSATAIPGVPEQRPSRPGNTLLINRRKKKVTKSKKVIVCKVEFDGELKPLKPMFFPEFDHKKEFDMSVVTTKDIRDIHSSIKLGVDYISVSYVESKEDI